MHLLHLQDDGELSLVKRSGNDIPRYAILSHTWGSDDDEVTFQDITSKTGKSKAGYRKIRFCGKQAKQDGLQHFWVDTCCIDKSSSAELSEAINSMFRWYQNAERCYVYLSDVSDSTSDKDGASCRRWKSALRKSRWFARGWTLQELIAPSSVEFFSKEEERLGDKRSLEQTLHEITGIPLEALRESSLSSFSTGERFSWAARRQTQREEDEAYCLLGIFGIHLPLIYGEGRLSAMKRLLNEVEGPAIEHLRAIREDANVARTCAPAIQSGVERIQQEQDTAEHRRVLEWLSPTDYPAQQSDIVKRRQEGTGRWFLGAPEVARWHSEARASLFCPGIPGAGKTMVAAIAIDHLLKSVQSSSCGVAYVYCNYKAQEEQDASTMLAAILRQLVQGRPLVAGPVERLHWQHADRGTRPSLDDISGALRDTLARYSTAYIVIDALDECRNTDGTRRQFLTRLQDLRAGRDVRLMVTSRFIPEIEDGFRGALRLEVQASKEGVKRFVAGQTYRLPRCIQRDLALQREVQEKIVEAADGMFLLARLHTDSLLDKRTPKDVKSTLAQLSNGSASLQDAYSDALQRIEGQLVGDRKLARKVLSWITMARRPLTTAEICCALAVKAGDTRLDPENVPVVEDLVSVCAGLVVVDQESSIIRLVHYTTQEYFECVRHAWNPRAQVYIAKVYITYLSFAAFRSGSCSNDRELEERLQQNQFLDYAAKHWGEHVGAVEEEVCELACSFLHDSTLLLCTAQVSTLTNGKWQGYSQHYVTTTGLHCAARFGLCRISEELITSVEGDAIETINAKDSQGRAALLLAAAYGHGATVRLLLDKGADVDAQGGSYGDALHAASVGGHEAVVQLLVDKGADVNAQGGLYGNALQAASRGGHEAVVRLLRDKGTVT